MAKDNYDNSAETPAEQSPEEDAQQDLFADAPVPLTETLSSIGRISPRPIVNEMEDSTWTML